VERDERDRTIVRSVIGLADGLGCRATAEGVETPQTAAWLAEAGCACAQGFFFCRPLPAGELVNRHGRHAYTSTVIDRQPQPTMEDIQA
jgi:EAL domain-containing protein (putative c-di-GMP-specific phosphodiesterase class I)